MERKEAREGGDVQEKRRVMVAIDDSECSHYALEWALENLRDSIAAHGAAPLVVFTVQPLANLSYIPAATYGSAPPELIRSLQEHQRKISLALLEHAKEICAKYAVNAETITEVGDPKDSICEAVEKYKVKLLILGSHGRGMFQRVWFYAIDRVHGAYEYRVYFAGGDVIPLDLLKCCANVR